MSRIGKQPIILPSGVIVHVDKGTVTVENGKNKLPLTLPAGITVEKNDNKLVVKRADDSKLSRSLHGTIRMLLANMVKGVTEGFKRELDIVGVGYKVQAKGKKLVLNIGFSHAVEVDIPEGIQATIPVPTRLIINGADKQKVGEFAAEIRDLYPPEPYKGKGIRYTGEEVRKKLGKAIATKQAA